MAEIFLWGEEIDTSWMDINKKVKVLRIFGMNGEIGPSLPGHGLRGYPIYATRSKRVYARSILGSMGSRLDQLRAQRETILEIVSRNMAGNVAVFGSVARGEDTLETDVDLLVDFLPGASLTDQ